MREGTKSVTVRCSIFAIGLPAVADAVTAIDVPVIATATLLVVTSSTEFAWNSVEHTSTGRSRCHCRGGGLSVGP